MMDALRDVILVVSGGLVVLALYRTRSAGKRVSAGVLAFVVAGFALVVMGRVLEMVDAETIGMSEMAKGLLQEVVGFSLGFVLLTIGLVRWVPEMTGRPKPVRAAPPKEMVVDPAVAKGTQNEHSASEMLTSVMRSSLGGVLVVTAMRDDAAEIVDFEVALMNESAQQILGRSSTSLVGRGMLKEFACIRDANLLAKMVSVVETNLPLKDEQLFKPEHGPGRWYQYAAVRLRDGLAVTFSDISDRKRADEQLRHAAHHDTLTELPNRALFTERLERAINRARRFPDYTFALLFLDFDRFKFVNDTLGHDAGDQLLIGIADRLRANLRAIDTSSRCNEHLPARLGGDEFVVLLDNVHGIDDAVTVAERLQVELSEPHRIDGHDVVSTASIGIVSSELGYESADDMMRDADTAMYEAKMAGKARHVVFDERMHQAVVHRTALEKDLRAAVENDEFTLEFEPIVRLATGRIAGFEVHVRWAHPEHREVASSEFLQLAEELGLSVALGEWMITETCRQLRRWQGRFPNYGDLAAHVNLSRIQLQHPNLIPHLRRVLEETLVPPVSLYLEMNETMIMGDTDATSAVFKLLEETGVKIAMDEFGSGSSSLRCLHRFPIDMLKIDRGFVTGTHDRSHYRAIINAIVELAQNLGMEVVAEGAESEEQLTFLQGLDCDLVQGPSLSVPLSANAATDLLAQDSPFKVAA